MQGVSGNGVGGGACKGRFLHGSHPNGSGRGNHRGVPGTVSPASGRHRQARRPASTGKTLHLREAGAEFCCRIQLAIEPAEVYNRASEMQNEARERRDARKRTDKNLTTNNNTVMGWLLKMQALEIASVNGDHCTFLPNRIGQHVGIFDALVVAPCFAHGQNIMTQIAQCDNDLEREVLVGI